MQKVCSSTINLLPNSSPSGARVLVSDQSCPAAAAAAARLSRLQLRALGSSCSSLTGRRGRAPAERPPSGTRARACTRLHKGFGPRERFFTFFEQLQQLLQLLSVNLLQACLLTKQRLCSLYNQQPSN